MKRKLLKIFKSLGSRGFFKWMSSETYIKIVWFLYYGKKINLNNPKSFNEKTQWLKLNDHKSIYGELVDKIKVKDIVSKKIGDQYIIKNLWIGNKPEDIPYDSLPNQFVIKCSHGSHCSIICKDKSNLNIKKANSELNKWLKMNWFWYGREWVYKDVEPRILVEEYLEDEKYKELVDYKFYCFDGEPKVVDVCTKRYSKNEMGETYMDPDWNFMGFKTVGHACIPDFPKPKNLQKMLEVSKKLSKGFKFLRVDLYEINGKMYFGELTFYSADGYEEFDPECWNEKMGDMLKIK